MASVTSYDELFDFDDEVFEDPFMDDKQLSVTMKKKTEAGKFEVTTEVDQEAKEAGGPVGVSVAAKADWTVDKLLGGMHFKLALKDSGIIEQTSTLKGLGAVHESLEGCELGLKVKCDTSKDAVGTPPQLAFNYIKDWIDYRWRLNLETEDP
jgi:hypothetical protein